MARSARVIQYKNQYALSDVVFPAEAGIQLRVEIDLAVLSGSQFSLE